MSIENKPSSSPDQHLGLQNIELIAYKSAEIVDEKISRREQRRFWRATIFVAVFAAVVGSIVVFASSQYKEMIEAKLNAKFEEFRSTSVAKVNKEIDEALTEEISELMATVDRLARENEILSELHGAYVYPSASVDSREASRLIELLDEASSIKNFAETTRFRVAFRRIALAVLKSNDRSVIDEFTRKYGRQFVNEQNIVYDLVQHYGSRVLAAHELGVESDEKTWPVFVRYRQECAREYPGGSIAWGLLVSYIRSPTEESREFKDQLAILRSSDVVNQLSFLMAFDSLGKPILSIKPPTSEEAMVNRVADRLWEERRRSISAVIDQDAVAELYQTKYPFMKESEIKKKMFDSSRQF